MLLAPSMKKQGVSRSPSLTGAEENAEPENEAKRLAGAPYGDRHHDE